MSCPYLQKFGTTKNTKSFFDRINGIRRITIQIKPILKILKILSKNLLCASAPLREKVTPVVYSNSAGSGLTYSQSS